MRGFGLAEAKCLQICIFLLQVFFVGDASLAALRNAILAPLRNVSSTAL
jgi:hypothetical protein